MKSITNDYLYPIGRKYLDIAMPDRAFYAASKIKRKIILEFDKKANLLEPILCTTEIAQLEIIMELPQIRDLLAAYLRYTIYFNLYKKLKEHVEEPEKEFLTSDVTNYILQVIGSHFADMPEPTILAIKKIIEILTEACSMCEVSDAWIFNLGNWEKMNNVLDLRMLLYFSQNKFGISIPKVLNTTSNKIRYIIENEFIPPNLNYSGLRVTYTKAMKRVYQDAFVYMLGECNINDFYIPPLIINGPKKIVGDYEKILEAIEKNYRSYRDGWKNIFVSDDIIYIVGGPGFGKTLFLENIVNNYSKLNLDSSEKYLLIYCDLKTYYSKSNPNKKSMIDFFQESMINSTGLSEEQISKEFIQYHLDLGRCIILLDALDEVPKGLRRELHKKIIGYFSTCNPNNKIIITSRDRGFLPQADIEVFEIFPLTPMDIEDYLDKMISLNKFKENEKKCFMEQAQILIDKKFLNNFLVLSLMVSIYKAERKLPENKTLLYKKCYEYIAKEREIVEKNEIGYKWKTVRRLMKESTFIALSTLGVPNNNDIDRKDVEKLLLEQYKTKYGNEAETECAIKEFLEFCSSRTELFVPSSVDDKFKFFHRSFHEYFYSRYIHQCATVEEMYELMSVFDVDSEVFELTVALVKEDNEVKYQKLILYLVSRIEHELNSTPKECTDFSILTLAMQVVDDAYFKQLYFDILIKYSNSLESKIIIDNLNKRLMAMYALSVIDEYPERLDEFKAAYETNCLIYIFDAFNEFSKVILKKGYTFLHVTPNTDEWRMAFMKIQGLRQNFPFYVIVYVKCVNLYEKMESYKGMPIDKIINNFYNLSHGMQKRLKRGLKIYESLDCEDKREICNMVNDFEQNNK